MKTSVLLLFGGESSEHEVSINSARNVYDALDKATYDVRLGYISKDGSHWSVVQSFDSFEGVEIFPMMGQKKFWSETGEIDIDVIMPILHGKHGEDGDIQAIARLLHVACVGPSLIGAAITMDKDVAKRLFINEGIPVVDWIAWHISETQPTFSEVSERLGIPMFVKPANAGSSVGVSKVSDEQGLKDALAEAREHDELVLIERAVNAREIELAVIGNETPQVSVPGEVLPGEEFYSYSDKYDENSTSQVVIAAQLKDETVRKLQEYAAKGYLATRGWGMARVDFFVDENENIYLNEINSIPGFTNISMYPKLMMNTGMTYAELCDKLIELALEAYNKK